MPLPLLLEAENLLPHIDDENVLIVDLCSEQSYQQNHLPNAVYLAPSELMLGETPAPGKLPSIEKLSEIFSRLNLKTDTHIVCYDDEGGGWAGRLIWTLDVIGHKHYSYLNGGIQAWRALELPLSKRIPSHTDASQITVSINSNVIINAEEIMQEINDKNFLVWDARSPAELSGEKVLAKKGGHIPGAINCEWTSLMDKENHLRLRNDAKEYLESLGITANKKIITHCQTHHRSGFTYLVAKILGFPDIRAYPGSWSEWGNLDNTPIET